MSSDDDTVTCYPDDSGCWRWRRQAANGEIIAASGESFSSKSAAIRAAVRANPYHDVTVVETAPPDDAA